MSKKREHVAVAVIVQQQRVLIALRKPEQHLGGFWEFPGGKVEADETVVDALTREIDEELGVQIKHAEPLIEIKHDYPDKSVCLDVWWVDDFTGEAVGKEQQQIKWCPINELAEQSFPAANEPILAAIQQHIDK